MGVTVATDLERGIKRHRTKAEKKAEGLEIINRKILGHRDIDIARDMGMSTMTVQRRLAWFVQEHGASSVEAYREVTVQQLEAVMSMAMGGLVNGDMDAANLVLKVIERKAKLLGIDAPVTVDVEHRVVSDQELRLRGLLEETRKVEALREEAIIRGDIA